MNKTCFLLITVIEREILTEQFTTKRDAWLTMRQEMVQACDPYYRESVEGSLMLVNEGDYVYMNDNFAIGEWEAYMDDNVTMKGRLHDWRIVEIEV